MDPHGLDPMLLGGDPPSFSQGSLFEQLGALDDGLALGSPEADLAPSDRSDAGHAEEADPDDSEAEDTPEAAPTRSRVLPEHLWPEGLETMPLSELRNVQHLTAHYVRLNMEAKLAARRLEEKYHADMIRLAIKHQVLGTQLLTYLGDGRRLRPPNRYNNFFRLSEEARKIHKANDLPIGQRSKAIGREWRKLDPATRKLWSDKEFVARAAKEAAQDAAADHKTKVDAEPKRADGRKTSSRPKSTYDYRSWMSQIDLQMKAMRLSECIEGYLVVVPTNPDRPPHVIATPLGKQYLRLQTAHLKRTPVEDFAHLVTGKVVEARLLGLDIDQVGLRDPPKKAARGHVAEQFAHLAGASLKDLRRNVRDRLKALLSEASGRGFVGGWPAQNTDSKLKQHALKIAIDPNARGFDAELLRKPGRDLNKDEALHVLDALDHHWVSLVQTRATADPIPAAVNQKRKRQHKKKHHSGPVPSKKTKKNAAKKRRPTDVDASSVSDAEDSLPATRNKDGQSDSDTETPSDNGSDYEGSVRSEDSGSDES